MIDLIERQKFAGLREKWHSVLSDVKKHPGNNIANQLLYLTDRYRYWQSLVNESRSFRFDKNEKYILKCNPFLDHFIDIGVIYSQAIGISALAFNSEEDDASLRRILIEIKNSRKLITRENFVFYDSDLEYQNDFKKEYRIKENKLLDAKLNEITGTSHVYGSIEPEGTLERRHGFFDIMSGVKKEKRSSSDQICDDYFDHLEDKLDSCQKEKEYFSSILHKKIYITTKPPINKPTVTYDDLEECHKALWYVFHSIYIYFTDGSYGTSATYQGDIFSGLENPWISEKDLQELRDKDYDLSKINQEDFWHYYGENDSDE